MFFLFLLFAKKGVTDSIDHPIKFSAEDIFHFFLRTRDNVMTNVTFSGGVTFPKRRKNKIIVVSILFFVERTVLCTRA